MSIFTRGEIERRHERLRARLGEADVGVGLSFTNAYYLSGVPIIPWGRPTLVAVPKDSAPFMVLSAAEAARTRLHSPMSDLATYDDSDGPNAVEAVSRLADVLAKRGLKRVAVDSNMARASMIDQLRSLMPGASIADASDTLDRMRLVSSDEEIAWLRAATATADAGMEAFLANAALGRPESVIAAEALLAMSSFAAEAYPDAEVRPNCYCQQGVRSLQPHTAASGEPLTAGRLMCVVVEAHVWSYMAAVERTLALGDLDQPQQDLYDTIVAAHHETMEAVRPGVRACDVDRVGRERFAGAGYTDIPAGVGLVRGILTEWEGRIDQGDLRPYNTDALQPDMVLSIEPWAVVQGIGAPRHCDMVRVTETGCEVLSKTRNHAIRIG